MNRAGAVEEKLRVDHSSTSKSGSSEAQFPGALPASARDPLKTGEPVEFWATVDKYFAPISVEDVQFLRALDSQWKNVDGSLCVGRRGESVEEKTARRRKKKGADKAVEESGSIFARLASFPYTHRLVAALIDEGQGGTENSIRKGTSLVEEDFPWLGIGDENNLREYQKVLEGRIVVELRSAGIIDGEDNGELVTALREEQWRLRGVRLGNSVRCNSLYKHVVGSELKLQGQRREKRRQQDSLQLAYLDRMARNSKFNKRTRAKFTKLRNQMFPDRKTIVKANKSANKAVAKKKRQRQLSKGKTANKARGAKFGGLQTPASSPEPESSAPEKEVRDTPMKLPIPSSGSRDAAETSRHVADIIAENGGEAATEFVVSEFIKRVGLTDDVSSTRRRVISALSFSRRPYRFRKLANGARYALVRPG